MKFELETAHKEIKKAVREFARGKFDKEMIIERSKAGRFPADIWAAAADLGFTGIHFPEKFEGAGMGLTEYVLVAEELCRNDSTLGIALMMGGFGAECIYRFAESRLAGKYIPPVAGGKTRCAAALFESKTGCDPAAATTTARAEGDHWIIRGEKAYVPNGLGAGFYVVLCATGEEGAGKQKRLSLIVVDADLDGITAVPAGPTLGGNLVDFAHVSFDGVRVPAQNLVGKEGCGLGQALGFVDESRIQLSAMALGTAQGAFERAADYVRQREQFGKKLAAFQVTRHKLADMAAKIDAARWVVYNAATAFDRNKADRRSAAAAKLTAASAAMAVTDEAIQLLGGYGYMTEYEVEHFYRDAKTLGIFMGTPGTLKDDMAGAIIGKLK